MNYLLNMLINNAQAVTRGKKHWGCSGQSTFCLAPTSVTVDTNAARSPQRFLTAKRYGQG